MFISLTLTSEKPFIGRSFVEDANVFELGRHELVHLVAGVGQVRVLGLQQAEHLALAIHLADDPL